MRRIKFKDFAGVRIGGKVDIGSNNSPYHIDRAEWITAMVESSGKFGTVISYDGTGITAGLHQCVAVLPRHLNTQGSLWRLLNRVRAVANETQEWQKLRAALAHEGWTLGRDGKLRKTSGGKLVFGKEMRAVLTGDADGKMPSSGPGRKAAEKWAELFHELFLHPSTFKVQRNYGLEHFMKRNDRVKLRWSKSAPDLTIQEAVYGAKHFSTMTDDDITPELDLAMALFWSNTVNAPGAALKRLCRAYDKHGSKGVIALEGAAFARHLITRLGNTSFGRWDDDIPGGRYQRTRKWAMKVWPKHLFTTPNAVMPKDLPG